MRERQVEGGVITPGVAVANITEEAQVNPEPGDGTCRHLVTQKDSGPHVTAANVTVAGHDLHMRGDIALTIQMQFIMTEEEEEGVAMTMTVEAVLGGTNAGVTEEAVERKL